MSSVSAIFGAIPAGATAVTVTGGGRLNSGRSVIVCSSRPQKKATAHHKKTRPRKSQPWDINRKPTVYAPLPPMPPDWTLLAVAEPEAATPEAEAAIPESAPPPPPESD